MKIIKNFIKKLYIRYIFIKGCQRETKDLKKRKKQFSNINLTEEQIKSVDELWLKNYGKKISKEWHRLYTSYNGQFNEKYFPEIFLTTNLLNKLNPSPARNYLDDKSLLSAYLYDLEDECRIPKNYVYNCNDYFYDKNGIITLKKTIEILYNIGESVIKPSSDTSSGKNVRILNVENGIDSISNEHIEEILKKYGKNFVVQEKIKPHKDFAKLYPTAINTVRINSYICDGKVYIAPIALRLGRNNSYVDNSHAGGIAVGVTSEGKLMKYAFSQDGEKFDKHPNTNIVFENYQLPKIKEMIEFTKKNHYRFLHMGIVAWDLTVDENNNIVVIEANITAPSLWFPQYCTGEAFFGENTEKMIKMLNNKQDFK